MVASAPKLCARRHLETDIPEGGTLLGFGVKFPKEGESKMMGQNMRASPVVMQYVKRKVYVAWPKALQTIDPVSAAA